MLQRTVHLRQAEASGTAYARFHFLNSHLGSVAESTFVKTAREIASAHCQAPSGLDSGSLTPKIETVLKVVDTDIGVFRS